MTPEANTAKSGRTPGGRTGRQRARTHAALVSAAQTLLAQRRTHVTIREITETANVGFGSFFNHFTSKEELFEEAIHVTLANHGEVLDSLTRGIDDPARVLALGIRSTGRLQRKQPEMARILLHQGTRLLLDDAGLTARARANLAAGVKSGRFAAPADVEFALMAILGALLGVVQFLDAHPEADAGASADQLAEGVLVSLAVESSEARRIVREPLPPAFDI
ncbi:TetR/AcrR family transcriptional regulator [Streptomyces sp. NPDC093094]|uniref:TetR/AcrR family transcriptional regulator n=1 Tax=Streptomyces sp. NPDC093094 TaxID=3366026 RepID=UPI0038036DA5